MSSVRQRLGVRDIARLNQLGGINAATAQRAISAANADRAAKAVIADKATKAARADLAANSEKFGGYSKGFWLNRVDIGTFDRIYLYKKVDGLGVNGVSLSNVEYSRCLFLINLVHIFDNGRRRYVSDWIAFPVDFKNNRSQYDQVLSSGTYSLELQENRMDLVCSTEGYGILEIYRLKLY